MRVTINLCERDAERLTLHQIEAGFERVEDFALALVQQSLRERDKARQDRMARGEAERRLRERGQEAARALAHRRASTIGRDDAVWRGFLGGV